MNYLYLANVVIALLMASSTRGSIARLDVLRPHSTRNTTRPHRPDAMQTTTRPRRASPVKATKKLNLNVLTYHGGQLLTTNSSKALNVYLIWYGHFSPKDKVVITDFFASFDPSKVGRKKGQPTVAKWWKTITSYKDKSGRSVPGTVKLVKEVEYKYLFGKKIVKRAAIADLVQEKVEKKVLPNDPHGIYLVLTSSKVPVERFCMSACSFHGTTLRSTGSASNKVVIAHVGDASLQCPGFCAWPYAVPPHGPPFKALTAPNSVGTDGMIINIARALAGASTNPFNNGYFRGDPHVPLEAVSACSGKFGVGAFPGFPGKLLNDPVSNVAYNAFGANSRKFLLPAMWDVVGSSCKVVS